MKPNKIPRNVIAFFESYRAAFERLDANTIADHFTYPCHITSDGAEIGLIPIQSKQEWIDTIERLLSMYRTIGFSSGRIVDMAATELSPRLLQTVVHWALYDVEERALYEFEAAYTLAAFNDALRIVAIAHNEIPRYRECFARLKSQVRYQRRIE